MVSSPPGCRSALAVLLCLLPMSGCSGERSTGAPGLVTIGTIGPGTSRARGACLATCAGDQVCNPATGFCEPDPCGTGCQVGQHCDISRPVPRCADDRPAAVDGRPEHEPMGKAIP
jgi:hypothetical protein